MDGHPRFLIARGQTYVYEFEVINRAGTYWYHPHHHTRTGPQVYAGLAGLLIVSDDTEAALGLPSGQDEICCVLQDRVFDASNQFVYRAGMPMDQMNGFLGDRVLVNGQERPSLALGTRAYRLRLLNASNSRIYKLGWDDGTAMTLIGTDGGLLERPIPRSSLTLAPGERADLILDLRSHRIGTSVSLRSLPFSGVESSMGMGMGAGMGRMMSAGAVPTGAPLSILTVQVQRSETSDFQLPARLSTFDASWQPSGDGSRDAAAVYGDVRWHAVAPERPNVRPGERGIERNGLARLQRSVGIRQSRRRHDGHAHGPSSSRARQAIPGPQQTRRSARGEGVGVATRRASPMKAGRIPSW